MKNKFILCVATLVLTISMSTQVLAAPVVFKDNDSTQWFFSDVTYASEKGWVSGYPDGNFHPNDLLTKAQAITMISRAMGFIPTENNPIWYMDYLTYAVSNNFVQDVSKMDAPISRYDTVKMLYFAYSLDKYSNKLDTKSPFSDIDDTYVTTMYRAGIINGVNGIDDLKFMGESSLTRAQLCAMMSRADKNKNNLESIMLDKQIAIPTIDSKYMIDRFPDTTYDIHSKIDFIKASINNSFDNKFVGTYTLHDNEDGLAKDSFMNYVTIFDDLTSLFPEYFNIYSGYSSMLQINQHGMELVLTTKPREGVTEEETTSARTRLFNMAKESIEMLKSTGKITSLMSETEIAKNIAVWIVENCEYDTTLFPTSHYGADFFDDKTLVCDGYAGLYNLMLRLVNIESFGIHGEVGTAGGHMWNVVKLDGNWRMVDVTYMDQIAINQEGVRRNVVNYKFFNITREELAALEPSRTIKEGPFKTLKLIYPDIYVKR